MNTLYHLFLIDSNYDSIDSQTNKLIMLLAFSRFQYQKIGLNKRNGALVIDIN